MTSRVPAEMPPVNPSPAPGAQLTADDGKRGQPAELSPLPVTAGVWRFHEARRLYATGMSVEGLREHFGLDGATVRKWLCDNLECEGCGAELIESSPTGLCGFCEVERAA